MKRERTVAPMRTAILESMTTKAVVIHTCGPLPFASLIRVRVWLGWHYNLTVSLFLLQRSRRGRRDGRLAVRGYPHEQLHH